MPLCHWLQLALTDGIGPILIRRVIEGAGGVEAACEATPRLLRSVEGIGSNKASDIARSLQQAKAAAESELAKAQQLGVRIICPDDEQFPPLLRAIPDPPAVLYVQGDLQPRDLHALAIVGSRKCSFYGREQSERFAALAAGAGLTVVSGGARGIDSAAHRGALSHPQGRTIAVLGSGVDVTYPPENESLFRQIAARGAVISEWPLGTPPNRENFPRRNRIVSGLSRGVLVIEAGDKSGALITARQANEDHGRPVFALPGRVDSPLSAGPHALIRDGATLVRTLQDILDGMDPLPQQVMESTLFTDSADTPATQGLSPLAPSSTAERKPVASNLSDRQQTIIAAMEADPVEVDQLIERTGLAAEVILQELTMLSLRGAVRRVGGQTYARRIVKD